MRRNPAGNEPGSGPDVVELIMASLRRMDQRSDS